MQPSPFTFGPVKVSRYNRKTLQKVFSELKIPACCLSWKMNPDSPESVRIDIDTNAPDFADHTFDFIKLKRNRYIIFDEIVWIVHITNTTRINYGWHVIPWSLLPANMFRAFGTAEALYSIVKNDFFGFSSGGDAIRAAQDMNLWLLLNRWGWTLCILIPIIWQWIMLR